MAKKLNLALIGLGRVAWLLENDPLRAKPCTHLGAWLQRKDVRLVAGCDTNPERRALFKQHYPKAEVYADYRQMLQEQRPELLTIAAYATERAQMVKDSAKAGVKGIWCEKAMASNLKEADAIIRTLKRHDTKMIVSYVRRWSPNYLKVRDLIQQGAIGHLESVTSHFSGNMMHTGTHAFDVLRLWCGEVESVQAWLDRGRWRSQQSGYRFSKDKQINDYGGFALLHFKNGVRGAVHGNDKRYFRFEFELLGSEGMIRVGNTQLELWNRAASKQAQGFSELQRVDFPPLTGRNIWSAAVEDLLAAVRKGSVVSCSAHDARAALAIGLAMHQSENRRHRLIDIKDVDRELTVLSR